MSVVGSYAIEFDLPLTYNALRVLWILDVCTVLDVHGTRAFMSIRNDSNRSVMSPKDVFLLIAQTTAAVCSELDTLDRLTLYSMKSVATLFLP
jgi:hypothetical protein